MMEEEQISFRSDSSMFEGIEDYSHQIAGMIGLRNVSNFIQAGVSKCTLELASLAQIISPFTCPISWSTY